ncbi:MFS transporter [Acidipila rosea]|uniref:Putative MFS family arabinose efflux permease n=1 Tax=Acidipila rosea TaxID=768535 RepID=A0A4R1L9Z3_9BACT|nr:MFS transporter [Acidipila rosea]TCK74197.1 putative MFS family arabinose efflux permease [Acidipila rosea]
MSPTSSPQTASQTASQTAAAQTIETHVPARLDRLPWSRWHVRIITALGASWLLDGLQVTLAGSLAGILENKHGLGLTVPQVTASASTYLAGAVIGAILFGWLTDRLGRKRLFLITLATYSLATLASALSWNFFSFAIFRAITGLGIGGEYAAINSAVDELIPGRVRGRVDLVVNATFWGGAAIGSLASLFLLGSPSIPPNVGWRVAFSVGAVLGLGVLMLRLGVPESPRWLMLRGRTDDADRIVKGIEEKVEQHHGQLPPPEGKKLRLHVRHKTPWAAVFRNILKDNRQRSFLALTLMVAQSFFFNSVFFTYGLVVKRFYGVTDQKMPLHLLPFAVGCLFGPILLGRLFDTVGRKPMIAATYGISGLLLIATVVPFALGHLSVRTLDIRFTVIFFVASSAASAAYLTVSEIFPLEIRAFAIAIFYALGTLAGGVGAPIFFGELIASGIRWHIGIGYLVGAALMLLGAICELTIGVEAAGQSLESISKPLQSE